MSFSSSGEGSGLAVNKRQRGFREEDVNLFLQRGATLASRKKTPGQASIGEVAPRAVDRFIPKESKDRVTNLSKEKIASLASAFKQREQNIAQRRAQPGRSSLFMGRA